MQTSNLIRFALSACVFAPALAMATGSAPPQQQSLEGRFVGQDRDNKSSCLVDVLRASYIRKATDAAGVKSDCFELTVEVPQFRHRVILSNDNVLGQCGGDYGMVLDERNSRAMQELVTFNLTAANRAVDGMPEPVAYMFNQFKDYDPAANEPVFCDELARGR